MKCGRLHNVLMSAFGLMLLNDLNSSSCISSKYTKIGNCQQMMQQRFLLFLRGGSIGSTNVLGASRKQNIGLNSHVGCSDDDVTEEIVLENYNNNNAASSGQQRAPIPDNKKLNLKSLRAREVPKGRPTESTAAATLRRPVSGADLISVGIGEGSSRIWERLGKCTQVLSERSSEWTLRMKALHEIRSLMPNVNVSDSLERITSIQQMCEFLCLQLQDKRSQIVKECCLALPTLAPLMNEVIPSMVPKVLQSLFQLTYVTVKVISMSAHECLIILTGKLKPSLVLNELLRGISDDHVALRQRCSEYALNVLHTRDQMELSCHTDQLKAIIARALNDNAVSVRNAGKLCFPAFWDKFPTEAESVLDSVGPAVRNALIRTVPSIVHTPDIEAQPSPRHPSLTEIRMQKLQMLPGNEVTAAGAIGEQDVADYVAYDECEQVDVYDGCGRVPHENVRVSPTDPHDWIAVPHLDNGTPAQTLDEHDPEGWYGAEYDFRGPPVPNEHVHQSFKPTSELAEVGQRIEATLRELDLQFSNSADTDEREDADPMSLLPPDIAGRPTQKLNSAEESPAQSPDSPHSDFARNPVDPFASQSSLLSPLSLALPAEDRTGPVAVGGGLREGYLSDMDLFDPAQSPAAWGLASPPRRMPSISRPVTVMPPPLHSVGPRIDTGLRAVALEQLKSPLLDSVSGFPFELLNSTKSTSAAPNRPRRPRPLLRRNISRAVGSVQFLDNGNHAASWESTEMNSTVLPVTKTLDKVNPRKANEADLGGLLAACDTFVLSNAAEPDKAVRNDSAAPITLSTTPQSNAAIGALWAMLCSCRSLAQRQAMSASVAWSALALLQVTHAINIPSHLAGSQVQDGVKMPDEASNPAPPGDVDDEAGKEQGYEADRMRRIERNRAAMAKFGLGASPVKALSDKDGDDEESNSENSDETYCASNNEGENSDNEQEDIDCEELSESRKSSRSRPLRLRPESGEEIESEDGDKQKSPSHPSMVDPESPGLNRVQRFRAEMVKALYESDGTSEAAAMMESSLPSVVARAFKEVGWREDSPPREQPVGGEAHEIGSQPDGDEPLLLPESAPERRRLTRRTAHVGRANAALAGDEFDGELDDARRTPHGNEQSHWPESPSMSGSGGGSASSARKRLRNMEMDRGEESKSRRQRRSGADVSRHPTAAGPSEHDNPPEPGKDVAWVGEGGDVRDRGKWCRRGGVKGKYYTIRNKYLCNNCGRAGHVRRTCGMEVGALDAALQAQGWQVMDVVRKGGAAVEKFYITPDRVTQLRGLAKLLAHLAAQGTSVRQIYNAAGHAPPPSPPPPPSTE